MPAGPLECISCTTGIRNPGSEVGNKTGGKKHASRKGVSGGYIGGGRVSEQSAEMKKEDLGKREMEQGTSSEE